MPDSNSLKASTQQIIDQFYEEEAKLKANEVTFTPVTLSLSAADIAMLEAIGKRFGKSRELVGRDALSSALSDMFSALKKHERKRIGKEADDYVSNLAQKIAEENGDPKSDVKINVWTQKDRTLLKMEAKAQKSQEKATTTKTSEPKKAAKATKESTKDSSESTPSSQSTPKNNTNNTDSPSKQDEAITSQTADNSDENKSAPPKSMFTPTDEQTPDSVDSKEEETEMAEA